MRHSGTGSISTFTPYSMLIRYMCTACAWEASGAVSGKFREISAPAAPLANFSLNFAKLLQTPRRSSTCRSTGCRVCRVNVHTRRARAWKCSEQPRVSRRESVNPGSTPGVSTGTMYKPRV